MLADVKLADGTFHSLLPVKIVPDTMGDGNVTVVIDDTMSPNLNDKVLRKSGDDMKRVTNWDREGQEKKMVIPLNTRAKDSTGKLTTLQDILSQGWGPAAQQGGMGGGMGGVGGGMGGGMGGMGGGMGMM